MQTFFAAKLSGQVEEKEEAKYQKDKHKYNYKNAKKWTKKAKLDKKG